MKVLITGSRHWTDRTLIETALRDAGATVVVHGGCVGADMIAHALALGTLRLSPKNVRIYPAKWEEHGRKAGPIRNQEMLDKEHTRREPIDAYLAFPLPESVGTHDMIRRCKKAGIWGITF
jgi:hypothetical protein